MHQHKAFRQRFNLAKYLVGQNFRRTKFFVGHNFRHFQKNSLLLSDIFLSVFHIYVGKRTRNIRSLFKYYLQLCEEKTIFKFRITPLESMDYKITFTIKEYF